MVDSVTYFAFIFKLVETPGCVCVVGEGGGYSDIFIHTYGLDNFFWFKILKFNMFFFFFLGGGGVRKNE